MTRIEKYTACINSVLTRNDNNLWNFRLGQITHTIFWEAEGLGEGV